MHVHAGTKPFGLSNARCGLTFFHFTWNLQPAESSLIFSRRNRVTFFQDHPEISRDRESLLPENLGRSEDRIHFSKNPLLVENYIRVASKQFLLLSSHLSSKASSWTKCTTRLFRSFFLSLNPVTNAFIMILRPKKTHERRVAFSIHAHPTIERRNCHFLSENLLSRYLIKGRNGSLNILFSRILNSREVYSRRR